MASIRISILTLNDFPQKVEESSIDSFLLYLEKSSLTHLEIDGCKSMEFIRKFAESLEKSCLESLKFSDCDFSDFANDAEACHVVTKIMGAGLKFLEFNAEYSGDEDIGFKVEFIKTLFHLLPSSNLEALRISDYISGCLDDCLKTIYFPKVLG